MYALKVVLISTYELGRQPFGLASPAAWLKERGHDVMCVDLAIATLPALPIREAQLVALYLPMHTATRLAAQVIPKVRLLNPKVHLCAYGLYAPVNAGYLKKLGVETILGGEFEQALADLAERLVRDERPVQQQLISLDRLEFSVPDRSGLPPLARYAKLHVNGTAKIAGYTEASRGCKHLCRHCPVVPVYKGRFRVVQHDTVMMDIRRQVEAGAQHITFGDPDFLNGPAHARRIVEELHREFPGVSYDATIKIEHLIQAPDLLPVLRDTGCVFVTTAVESVDDRVLAKLEKGHTRADFIRAAGLLDAAGLVMAPTFIPFTPWTTRPGYGDLLRVIAELGLVENVSPIQLALRLLVTTGSRLLELPDIQERIERFDEAALIYRWRHEDPDIDQLAARVLSLVHDEQRRHAPRREIFRNIWHLVTDDPLPENFDLMPRATIPYMDEPWYC